MLLKLLIYKIEVKFFTFLLLTYYKNKYIHKSVNKLKIRYEKHPCVYICNS